MTAIQTPRIAIREPDPPPPHSSSLVDCQLVDDDDDDIYQKEARTCCGKFKECYGRKQVLPLSQLQGKSGVVEYTNHSKSVRSRFEWSKLKVPLTLDKWRWGMQESLTLALVLWIPYVDVINNTVFGGNGRWCVPAAVAVIEGTAGGSTRRMIDRILGTLLAGAYVVCTFLIFCGTEGRVQDEVLWKRICTWVMICLSGWLWGWFRFRLPSHPLLGLTAALTTPILYTGGVNGQDPLSVAYLRLFACCTGVMISALVVRYFFPKRARIDVITNLETILKEMADALEPLVELESGLVSSPSFLSHGDDVFSGHSEKSHLEKPGGGGSETSRPHHRVRVLPDVWYTFRSTLWSHLERCGKLTMAQMTLMTAAKGEVSLRSHHRLFHNELREALVSTRTLFYHVTSLFTLIDTQVQATSASFEDASLYDEAQLFGRFGVLSLQAASDTPNNSNNNNQHQHQHDHRIIRDKTTSVPNLYSIQNKFKSSEPNLPLRGIPYSVADLGQLDMRRWDSMSSHHDTVFHLPKVPLDPVEEYNADVAPLLHWAEIYGPTVGGLVRHMCEALRLTARDLKRTVRTNDAMRALEKAGKLIVQFHRQRAERQQAVAILVEYSARESSKGGFWEDPKFAGRFDRVLGITPESYQRLSSEGREAFWTNYWILRDRLSNTDTTVVSLFVAVRHAVKAIETLIEERAKRMAKHHGRKLSHDMLVSADEVRLRAAIAVQKAGGAPRNIG